ncbi:MAG: hypothetical protein P8R42_27950 [Candidatus Binatia bacterium]|nr:hypothetical protein [Candidatus Binatia bacterium]
MRSGAAITAALCVELWAMPVVAQVPPEQDYVLHCSGCHRPDGSGAPDEVPSLVGLDRFLRLPEGRAYLIRAPGVAQAPVTDERLAALMNWVLVEFGGAGVSPAYTAAEVKKWRALPLRDPTELRARLLAGPEVAAEVR